MKRRVVRKEASLDKGSASAKPSASAGRNPGCAFNADWVASVRVNRSAVERRADTLPKRRTVKKDWQAAWLLKAVRTIDLTTLSGDDTPGTVQRICAKARQPVREDLLGRARRPAGRDPRRGGVRLPRARVDRGGGAARVGHPGGRRLHRVPGRPQPFRAARAGDRDVGGGRGPGDRHRHQPRPGPDRPLEGPLRRGAGVPQGLRARAHEDDPRHRRARHAHATSPGPASCA